MFDNIYEFITSLISQALNTQSKVLKHPMYLGSPSMHKLTMSETTTKILSSTSADKFTEERIAQESRQN